MVILTGECFQVPRCLTALAVMYQVGKFLPACHMPDSKSVQAMSAAIGLRPQHVCTVFRQLRTEADSLLLCLQTDILWSGERL